LKCRGQPECQRRQERGREGARHDRRVQRHGRRHVRREQIEARPRQPERDQSGDHGQDHALDDHLPGEARPGRAQSQPERYLPAAPGGPHQEQVRGVDAGDHENQNGDECNDGRLVPVIESRQTGNHDARRRLRVAGCAEDPRGGDAELGLDAVGGGAIAHPAHVSDLVPGVRVVETRRGESHSR
jgi:hypothetical protein